MIKEKDKNAETCDTQFFNSQDCGRDIDCINNQNRDYETSVCY